MGYYMEADPQSNTPAKGGVIGRCWVQGRHGAYALGNQRLRAIVNNS